jgi:hypothetical protein
MQQVSAPQAVSRLAWSVLALVPLFALFVGWVMSSLPHPAQAAESTALLTDPVLAS